MSKVRSFDRSVCRMVKQSVLTDLQNAAAKLGLSVDVAGGSYTQSNYTMKVQFSVVEKDGTVLTREREEWTRWAKMYDLPVDAIDKSVNVMGEAYIIKGLSPRRSKFPVTVERARDGKGFKLRLQDVRSALGMNQTKSGLTDAIKKQFKSLANQLSPENLSCDGELPRAQVQQRYRQLMNEWKNLEAQVGRTVSEDETWSW